MSHIKSFSYEPLWVVTHTACVQPLLWGGGGGGGVKRAHFPEQQLVIESNTKPAYHMSLRLCRILERAFVL